MPLCPECEEHVFVSEAECPHCGAALPVRPPGAQRSVWTWIFGVGAVVLMGFCLITLLLPKILGGITVGRLSVSDGQLRQLDLAIRNYADNTRVFPAGGTFTRDDRGMHGWMTALLPYVEQAHLFKQVDFRHAWNARENQRVFATVVEAYRNPNVGAGQSDSEGYALSHYAANSQALGRNRFLRMRDISDGASNTICLGEVAANYSPWGSPDNTRDPANGLGDGPDQFGPVTAGLTQVLMFDGSVRRLSANINPATLKALASPSGKEPRSDY